MVNIVSKFQVRSSNGLVVMMFWRLGGKEWLSELFYPEGVCRTAPATLGLVNMSEILISSTWNQKKFSVFWNIFLIHCFSWNVSTHLALQCFRCLFRMDNHKYQVCYVKFVVNSWRWNVPTKNICWKSPNLQRCC